MEAIDYFSENIDQIRSQFPGLARTDGDEPAVFLDGPAGTQVHQSVIEAMFDYMANHNANSGGAFATSVETEQIAHAAHAAAADFVGTNDPSEVVFGQNMTTLTFSLSRSLSRQWGPEDEIIVTRLDHDANVTPWVMAAQDAGAKVHKLDLLPEDYTLDLERLESLINRKTRLVAIGCASNATGGINPVETICEMARDAGALTFLDAVHLGPHGIIDVSGWNCDFLACSPYKFFGPHQGILWGRAELLNELRAYQVRPAGTDLPGKWMTGTPSYESMAGTTAAINYLANLGRNQQENDRIDKAVASDRRQDLIAAFDKITAYEQMLSKLMLDQLESVDGLSVFGICDRARLDERVPTFSITHESVPTDELARQLAMQGIYVWHGNYYALEFTESLNLEPQGMVRLGLVHYNTPDEIKRCGKALAEICSGVAVR